MKWYPSDPTGACTAINAAGSPYEEFTCLYPALQKTYLPWEFEYNLVLIRDWMVENPWFPLAACFLYAVGIVAGRAYFARREPWNWRGAMATWNLALSVFSAYGLCRTLPVLVHLYSNYSWQENFCMDPESAYGSGTNGVWVQLFILSKFPELFDTFFIVIHKKKLIFLHWYHHISVLLYCWHSYVTKAPVGIIFCVMNYAVHALMYFYYFLMAVHLKPAWFNAIWITVAQISQMIVGVAVTLTGWYLMMKVQVQLPDASCWMTPANTAGATVMYGSYLLLFLNFFFGRYMRSGKKKKIDSGSSSSSNGSFKGNKKE